MRLREEEVEAEEREEGGKIPLPRPAIAPATTTARRRATVAAARFLEPKASAIPTAAAEARIPTARTAVIEADRDAKPSSSFGVSHTPRRTWGEQRRILRTS